MPNKTRKRNKTGKRITIKKNKTSNKSKSKRVRVSSIKKTQKPYNTDKCKKQFCKNVFLPEREKVEMKFDKNYERIEVMSNKDDQFEKETADFLEKAYLDSCSDIYCNDNNCNKSSKSNKKWVKSFSQERKKKLIGQGAISGCRDLIKEHPDYYENI